MGLKSVYASVDDIPDGHKDFYKEEGEKFVLDVEGIDDHPKVRGVITANRENVRKRDEYKRQAEEFKARVDGVPEDFDADEWAQLKAGNGGKPDEALQALKDQHARAMDALKTKHAGELGERDKQIGERDGYIDRTLIDGGLKDALLDIGVNPDLMDGALASLRGNVKVQRSDTGDRKAIVDTDLGEVAVADFVREWSQTRRPVLTPLATTAAVAAARCRLATSAARKRTGRRRSHPSSRSWPKADPGEAALDGVQRGATRQHRP